MRIGSDVFIDQMAKQKINTKSSTEAELVGVSEFLPVNIWVQYFLEGQRYKLQQNKLLQDNKSAILLEENGKGLASQKSWHIDVRYFFVKDKVKSGDIFVMHCPTGHMIADFLTKPLQGSLFRRF